MRRRLVNTNSCVRRERVHRQGVLRQGGKSRDLLSEIDRLDAQPHVDALVGRTNHGNRLAHSSTVAQAVLSTCAGTSTTTPLGRCIRNAAAPGAMRTGTNVGADGAGSVTTPRLLSVECAVYNPLTDSPWAFAYPLSVCPCSRHTRRWSSQNCWRSVRRAFERGIACTIADTLHGILDDAPWHGRRPYGITHFTRRLLRNSIKRA